MDERQSETGMVKACGQANAQDVLTIINAAAEAYNGIIPPDRWHEPYMAADELTRELADGVLFSGYVVQDRLVGVMGVQPRHNVDLIRHAYVLPEWQGHGVGSHLLRHLCRDSERPILIGTWAAADWAIRFYERHGFARVDDDAVGPLLRTFWNVPDRQVATSVVLASPPLTGSTASDLVAGARAAG